MNHVSYAHVEHIKPKSRFPDLVVDWENLTLACTVCNTHKSDYYDDEAPLLNPYSMEPSEHLDFHGGLVLGSPHSDVGRRTVAKLRLDRAALMVERSESIQALDGLLVRWLNEQDNSEKDIMEEVIRDELADDRQYCSSLRAFARLRGFPT